MEEYGWLNIILVLVGGYLSVRQQHMTNISNAISDLPLEQRATRDKCFHPTGRFVEFKKEEVEQSIPDRFEKIVRRYPNQIAVKTKNYTLTYDELNKAANRVARAILGQYEGMDKPIALLLGHGAAMIIGTLAALKTGKILVPFDPSFPRARIVSILEHSQAGILVTNNRNITLAVQSSASNSIQVLNIDEIEDNLPDSNLAFSHISARAAFIIYTSGSTGQPKGIVLDHVSWLHNVRRTVNTAHLCKHDRYSLLRSCATTGGMKDIFIPLLSGAAICPFNIKEEGIAHLADWLIEEKITIHSSVSTVFRQFLHSLTGEKVFSKLRLIYAGGEPIYKRDIEAFKRHFSEDCLLLHMVGLTETGTVVWYFIDKHTQITGSVVPGGYAAEDMEVFLLDDDGQKVGFNQIGEIAVKSRYLSSGYWRRTDLTQSTFLPDPEDKEGKRIYRTGDLGRMLPDGCLMHLGRKDFQAKIRGNRIITDEIGGVLLNHVGIKEAAVVARENKLGEQKLVAYVVPDSAPAPTISELRKVVQENLPSYMIPSSFVMLESLPLTPNGKVDRLALPTPSSARPELDCPFVAPRTPIEEELAKIWAEVLSLDQVGIHDNFIDLGGHSLLATQVISRVINAFNVELPIKSLFESPTVADMVVVITENMAKKAGDEELTHMLAELESISDEEARKRLAEEGK